MEKILENCRDLQEPLQQATSSMRSDFARISSELHELQLQQARVRGNIEQALREDLQSFVLEELQVRRLNELEVLQAEDSRHRADIDALRQKQNAALEALRQEETVRRDALEAKCFGELQAVRKQLTNCMEAVSSMPPPSPVKAEDPDAVFERLLQELREECGVLGERLGEDVAQLRAQLAEGLGEVRTAQVQQAADLQVVRSAWDARWEELQAAKDAETKSEAAESPEAQIASFQQGLTVEDFQALQQRHESHVTEVKNRLSMQNREIEELQRQLLDTLRDLGAVRRLSSEVEGLRQERQRDIAELMDLAKQRDGEWSIFKAFGCRADKTTSERGGEDPLERQVVQASNMATSEDLELLRTKHRQEALELRTQQRTFFDEVLDQQASIQQQLSGELEAVRSHCDAAIGGFHAHQTNTVEVLRQQQRRMQQIQGQLLGDVGSLKSQLVESIRQQRSARTQEISHVAV